MTLPKERMKHALKLAKKGIYSVSPNPMVGCIIVKNDRVIGEGWHVKSGHNHAEINAIEDVRNKHGDSSEELLRGSEVFVTLEPCSSTGKTPPCSEALIKAGINISIIKIVKNRPNNNKLKIVLAKELAFFFVLRSSEE